MHTCPTGYKCGDSGVWSNTFTFKTIPKGTDWSPRLAVYGDMGAANAQSVPRLVNDIKNGLYDAILHVGDLAYDLDTVFTKESIKMLIKINIYFIGQRSGRGRVHAYP